MNKKGIISLLLIALLAFLLSCAKSEKKSYDSFHPGELWLDNNGVHINAHGGGILFQDGKYYWYGEHKISGPEGNKAQVGVHCYSSKDLYNWTDEGIALSVDTIDENSDITKGCVLERPKVIYNDKTDKYVMWFHLELKDKGYDAARTGVAIANNVTGPFTFLRSLRPNPGKWPVNVVAKDTLVPKGGEESLDDLEGNQQAIAGRFLRRDFPGGQMARDMTLFKDDDGKAYSIYASEENYTLNISELSEDYTSFTGRWYRLFPGGHNEAPAIFKMNDKYYLVSSGCTGWAPNAARSAVAPSIFGPWEELGNPCIGEDSELTFHSQSTYALPVQGKENAVILMFDRWMPKDPIDGRYIWLPVEMENERLVLRWKDKWNLDFFN